MSEVYGRAYDHGDTEVQIAIGDAVRTFTVESIRYSAPRSRGVVFGHQRVPNARTKGRVDPEGEAKFSKSVADDLVRFIGEKAGGLYDASMTWTVVHGSDEQEKVTDVLEEVEIDDSQHESTGPAEEPTMATFPFKWRNGTFSGVKLFKGAV